MFQANGMVGRFPGRETISVKEFFGEGGFWERVFLDRDVFGKDSLNWKGTTAK